MARRFDRRGPVGVAIEGGAPAFIDGDVAVSGRAPPTGGSAVHPPGVDVALDGGDLGGDVGGVDEVGDGVGGGSHFN